MHSLEPKQCISKEYSGKIRERLSSIPEQKRSHRAGQLARVLTHLRLSELGCNEGQQHQPGQADA